MFWMMSKGKKSIHHHRGTPLFSVCRPTPRSQSKKCYGVYHFPGKTREKGIHHRSGKKGIHHEASDPEKEKKKGFHDGGVYFFLPARSQLEILSKENVVPMRITSTINFHTTFIRVEPKVTHLR